MDHLAGHGSEKYITGVRLGTGHGRGWEGLIAERWQHPAGEVAESLHLYIPASPLSSTAFRDLEVDPDKVALHYDGGFHDPLLEQMAWAIRAEMIDAVPAGKMLIETLAAAPRVHILRQHSNLEQTSTSLPTARGALDVRRLRWVTGFIDTHLSENLPIEALAKQACLSPFHFARAFKSATGRAPHRY